MVTLFYLLKKTGGLACLGCCLFACFVFAILPYPIIVTPKKCKLDVVTHSCNPKTQRPKQEDYYELHFSRGTEWDRGSRKWTKQHQNSGVVQLSFVAACVVGHTLQVCWLLTLKKIVNKPVCIGISYGVGEILRFLH